MISIIDSFKGNSVFITLLNNCTMISVVRVCNLFGTDNENNHWKKLVDDYEVFRKQVILSVFNNLSEYKEYYNKLIKFRNDFVVHSIENDVKCPKLDKSLELLYVILKYILYNHNFIVEVDPIKNAQDFYDKMLNNTINIFTKYSNI